MMKHGLPPPTRPTVVAITGSSGVIGSGLSHALAERGSVVKRVVRREARGPDEISWHPDRSEIDANGLAGVDAIVNLAGENLFQRWTDSAKERIRESRVSGTSALARAIASMSDDARPRVLLSGSAVGIYGDRGDESLDEGSSLGDDFLAVVCKEWEAATRPAADAGVRVIALRTGIVLAREGGALSKFLLPFRLGLGGRLGSGQQWMSWIGIRDMIGAIVWLLSDARTAGPVNLVSPNPVNNAEFAHTLARVLRRPAVLPVPHLALELLLGELADAAILASQRVRPARLLQGGFEFAHPTLEAALRAEVATGGPRPA